MKGQSAFKGFNINFQGAYNEARSSVNAQHSSSYNYSSTFERHVVDYLERKYSDWFYRNELNEIYMAEIKVDPIKGVIDLLKEAINYETPQPISNEMLYDLAKIYAAYSHPELSEEEKISLLYTPLTYENLGENVAGAAIFDYKFGYHIAFNPQIMNNLPYSEKLEVYLHELKHIIQYHKGDTLVHTPEHLEGEATYYAEQMVKALNPEYRSIASEEYKRYAEEYARNTGKGVHVLDNVYVEPVTYSKSESNERSSMHPPYYDYPRGATFRGENNKKNEEDEELIPKGYLH